MDDFHRLKINRDRFKDNQKEIKRQDMNNEQMQKGKIFLRVVQTQAIFSEINVGKGRIRHSMTLKLYL